MIKALAGVAVGLAIVFLVFSHVWQNPSGASVSRSFIQLMKALAS